MKNKIRKQGLILSTGLTCLVLTTPTIGASASTRVPYIKDIFVALENVVSVPPNMFLVLDDSGSMLQYMLYDRSQDYEIPPDPYNFNTATLKFQPFPAAAGNMWKTGFQDNNITSHEDGVTSQKWDSRGKDACRFQYATPAAASGTLWNPALNATELANCRVYTSYYRTRMLTLKSSLALAIADTEGTYNIDWDFINNRDTDEIKLLLMDRNTTKYRDNMKELLKKVYNENAFGGTPTRRETSKMFANIRAKAIEPRTDWNLFAPAGANSTTPASELAYCKHNYAVILSDGVYNKPNNFTESDYDGTDHNMDLVHSDETIQSVVFKGDGTALLQRIVAGGTNSFYSDANGNTSPTLSDIVLKGWTEDLNATLENSVKPIYKLRGPRELIAGRNFLVNGRVIPTPGFTTGPVLATLPEIWNPQNSPANWQNIVTYTIGINLGDELTDTDMANKINSTAVPFREVPATEFNSYLNFARSGYVGRGGFSRVNSSDDLINTFRRIFKDAIGNSQSQAVSSAASSASQVTSKTTNLLFTTSTQSNDWQGNIRGNWMFSGVTPTLDEITNRTAPELYSDADLCYGISPDTTTDANSRSYDFASVIKPNGLPATGNPGEICPNPSAQWDAAQLMARMDNINARNIFSMKDTDRDNETRLLKGGSTGIVFEYNNMSVNQKQLFTTWASVLSGITPENLVDFIKGSNHLVENSSITDSIKIRKRKGGNGGQDTVAIGDFGRGAPYYLDAPDEKIWGAATSAAEVTSRQERRYVFASANDGMLHAFNALNGQEMFAYVPSVIYHKFDNLFRDERPHTAFVDGNVVVQDIKAAVANGTGGTTLENKSILVAGLGMGEKGLYALDVTNPATFNQSNVLWELQDKRLGNIIGKPSIIRVEGKYKGEEDRWVIVVGTGYGNISTNIPAEMPAGTANTANTASAANDKSGVMVIDPLTGEVLDFLELPGAEGVGEIAWIDHQKRERPTIIASYLGTGTDASGTLTDPKSLWGEADRGYVGDLNGNVWVLDFAKDGDVNDSTETVLKSAVTAGGTNNLARLNTGLAISAPNVSDGSTYTDGDPAPLFITTNNRGIRQPITTKITAIRHPSNRGYMLYVGTGEMFAVEPMAATVASPYGTKNAMYGIWDDIGDNFGFVTTDSLIDHNLTRHRLYLTEYMWEFVQTTFAGGAAAYSRVIDTSLPVKQPIVWANTLGNSDSASMNPSAYTHSNVVVSSGWVTDAGWASVIISGVVTEQYERIFQPPYVVTNTNDEDGITFMMGTLGGAPNSCSTEAASTTWEMSFRTDMIDGPLSPFTTPQADSNNDGVINDDDKVVTASGAQALGSVPQLDAASIHSGGKKGTGFQPTTVQSLNTNLAPRDGTSCNGISRSYKVVKAGGEVKEINICIPHTMSSWNEIE